MRQFVLLTFTLSALMLVVLPSFGQENVLAEKKLAVISWGETSHDFGTVSQGTPVSYEFQFENKGNVPLVISNVKASCGCTATNYPKNAIQPGESASITATYNAKNSGSFSKTVTVYTNTENSVHVLTIKGSVQ